MGAVNMGRGMGFQRRTGVNARRQPGRQFGVGPRRQTQSGLLPPTTSASCRGQPQPQPLLPARLRSSSHALAQQDPVLPANCCSLGIASPGQSCSRTLRVGGGGVPASFFCCSTASAPQPPLLPFGM